MTIGVYPEQVLVGKYRVERVLGVGGMGVVVAARHLQLDQTVALKFLHPATSDAGAASRFQREARNAVQLTSEHVARIYDVGALDTGAPYMVMEYLDGQDLGALLEQRGVLAITLAVDYILQACDAIAEAHALGIVHRDLKPPNLFLTRRRDGSALIKVIDFGISKSDRAGDLTATGQSMLGSPAYMAPEQLRSARRVDARADVWSLGVILHQLVFGRVPWDADTVAALSFQIAIEPLPPFPTEPAVPPGFTDVLRRCLEKDVERRFRDVHQLAVALHPFAPPHAQPLVDRIGRVLHGEAAMASAAPPTARPDPRIIGTPATGELDLAGQVPEGADAAITGRRRAMLGGAIAMIAVSTAFALLIALRRDARQPASSTSDPATAEPAQASMPSSAPARAPAAPAPPSADPSVPVGLKQVDLKQVDLKQLDPKQLDPKQVDLKRPRTAIAALPVTGAPHHGARYRGGTVPSTQSGSPGSPVPQRSAPATKTPAGSNPSPASPSSASSSQFDQPSANPSLASPSPTARSPANPPPVNPSPTAQSPANPPPVNPSPAPLPGTPSTTPAPAGSSPAGARTLPPGLPTSPR